MYAAFGRGMERDSNESGVVRTDAEWRAWASPDQVASGRVRNGSGAKAPVW